MTHSVSDLAGIFRRQARFCAALGSPLWAKAMAPTASDAESREPSSLSSPIGLATSKTATGRYTSWAVHYPALAGLAPALAAELLSTGGQAGVGLWPALNGALAANRDEIRRILDRPTQTNEVGRSAVFLGGFLEVAAQSGSPLRLLELGASAGLNLCWDRFSYRLGPHGWRSPYPALTLAAKWHGAAPCLMPPAPTPPPSSASSAASRGP